MKIKTILFNEFILPIKNDYFMWKDRRALKRACKYADHLSETRNGMKHVVLKDYKGDYVAINRTDFKLFRLPRRGRFAKSTTWQDVLEQANYITQ